MADRTPKEDLVGLEFALTPHQRRQINPRNYGSGPSAMGHAAAPGSGPAGETCRTCRHLVRRQLGKTYLKCGLMSAFWTGGGKTDIKARDAACQRWEGSGAGRIHDGSQSTERVT